MKFCLKDFGIIKTTGYSLSLISLVCIFGVARVALATNVNWVDTGSNSYIQGSVGIGLNSPAAILDITSTNTNASLKQIQVIGAEGNTGSGAHWIGLATTTLNNFDLSGGTSNSFVYGLKTQVSEIETTGGFGAYGVYSQAQTTGGYSVGGYFDGTCTNGCSTHYSIITGSGFSGFNLANPTSMLDVNYDATSTAINSYVIHLGAIGLFHPNANGTYFAEQAPSSFKGDLIHFEANGVNQLAVDYKGNTTIGSTATTSLLTVNGDINFTGNLYQNGVLVTATIADYNQTIMAFTIFAGIILFLIGFVGLLWITRRQSR